MSLNGLELVVMKFSFELSQPSAPLMENVAEVKDN
jgi:hypothetical protein